MSYRDFLRELVKVDQKTLAFYQPSPTPSLPSASTPYRRWMRGPTACRGLTA